MIRRVHLHGRLAKFGGPYELDVATAAEAVHALGCQIKGFRHAFDGGYFRVIRGDLRTGLELDQELCQFRFTHGDFHFVPVPNGAGKGKGIGKIVLGVALIAASVFTAGASTAAAAAAAGSTTAAEYAIAGGAAASGSLLGLSFGQVASFGLTMVLGGVSQLLTTAPRINDYTSRNSPDQRASFLFNGPVNVSEQGGPVPLIYGRVRCGSVAVSSGLKAEQIAA